MDKKTETEIDVKFLEVFEKGTASKKSEDDIKMSLLKAGAKFSSVNSIFNNCMIKKGLRLNRSDKLEVIEKMCNNDSGHEISTEKGFDLAIDAIVEKAQISMKSAASSIRSWAKANEIECFMKPRGGNGQGQTGFASKFYIHLLSNPMQTTNEIDNYIKEQPDRVEGSDVSENVVRHASHYKGIAKLVRAVYESVVSTYEK